MNVNQLHTAVNLSLQKKVTDTKEAQAAVMLQDFAKTQANVQAAAHPTLGKNLDVKA